MGIFRSNLEDRIANKFSSIEEKLRNSFALIRFDMESAQNSIKSINNLLINKKSQEDKLKKQEEKIKAKFNKNAEEFTKKTIQLASILSEMKKLQNHIIMKKDLLKIENAIKKDFRLKTIAIDKKLKAIEKTLKYYP